VTKSKAHQWVDNTAVLTISQKMSVFGARKCANCGAEQVKDSQTSWMRVIGYQWWPLVGRCKIPTSEGVEL